MFNQTMTEITALLRRHQFPQSHLHLFRVFDTVHDANSIDQTDTVGIGYNGRVAKNIPHNQIRTLSSNPRQFQQCIKIIRYLIMILFMEYLHAGADIPGLALSKSTRTDNFLNISHIRCCQRGHIRIFLIQSFYHYIHSGICTLGSKPDTDQ